MRKKTKKTPTQEELRKLFNYDKKTGHLHWKKKLNNRAPIGSIAGSMCGMYRATRIRKERYYNHRLVWVYHNKTISTEQEIDHINGKKVDNRIENLRVVKKGDNHRNRRMPTNNTSGVMGVGWFPKTNRWYARLCVGGKKISLGYHKKKKDAVKARKEAEQKYGYGENSGNNSHIRNNQI